jgi:hypothetical protein
VCIGVFASFVFVSSRPPERVSFGTKPYVTCVKNRFAFSEARMTFCFDASVGKRKSPLFVEGCCTKASKVSRGGEIRLCSSGGFWLVFCFFFLPRQQNSTQVSLLSPGTFALFRRAQLKKPRTTHSLPSENFWPKKISFPSST